MFTFIAPILRHRFVAFAKYRTYPTNKKARTLAGLFGRVDRSSMRVSVALDADCHMGDVSHRTFVEVKRVSNLSRYPIDKTDDLYISGWSVSRTWRQNMRTSAHCCSAVNWAK
jgi:hypothetical protein